MTVAYDDRLELDVPGCYPFMDGATQRIRDFSGKARHGTPSGFAADVEYENVTGLGQCMSISTPKYVNHGQILDYTVENFSFETIVNVNSFANAPILFYKGTLSSEGYYARFTVTGQISLYTSQSGSSQVTTSNFTLPITRFVHIIISRNGSVVKIYIDGSEVTYAASSVHINPASSALNFQFGRYAANGALDLNGRVLRYRSWSRYLGAAEVAEKYQAWVMGR